MKLNNSLIFATFFFALVLTLQPKLSYAECPDNVPCGEGEITVTGDRKVGFDELKDEMKGIAELIESLWNGEVQGLPEAPNGPGGGGSEEEPEEPEDICEGTAEEYAENECQEEEDARDAAAESLTKREEQVLGQNIKRPVYYGTGKLETLAGGDGTGFGPLSHHAQDLLDARKAYRECLEESKSEHNEACP